MTLCLIARNEEVLLPGCLESVRGVVDEIVLVDTGSTDRTVALARAAGATVVERPWDDDFSAPRNLAARHVRGGFILQLDADERLAPGSGPALLAAVAGGGFDLGMVRLHNAARQEARLEDVVAGRERLGEPILLPRVLRHAKGLEWRGAVHEGVGDWFSRIRGRRADLPVDLVHFGYVPSLALQRGKRERNIGLLRRRVAAEPGDVTPRGYLALELMEAGRLDEAAALLEEAWALLPAQPPDRSFLRVAVFRGLLALRRGDGVTACESAARGEGRDGPGPDFDYLRAFGLELQGQAAAPGSPERDGLLDRAEAAFRSSLRRLTHEGPFELVAAAGVARIQLHLGVIALQRGRAGDALAAFEGALAQEPGNPSALAGQAEALLELGEAGRALKVVERALGARPDGWLLAAEAAWRLGAAGDARLLLARADERRAAGWECPHRQARHAALARALAG
ncbi:MAG: glycosyltransferase [Anaeromyxobacter sp.]|nr:glycosyltransferase [Anaeromyxobacter sp.]MBL0276151.1 glycosyltransferase [Anaeromyxobacter sp.]